MWVCKLFIRLVGTDKKVCIPMVYIVKPEVRPYKYSTVDERAFKAEYSLRRNRVIK